MGEGYCGNGVIRIGRKGIKKFAFGDDGTPFEVDVVVAFQQWAAIDEGFRDKTEDDSIPTADMRAYHEAAVDFVNSLRFTTGNASEAVNKLTTAEALDFLARLREQYNEVARFFRPNPSEKQDSPDTSGADITFSEEGPSPDLTRTY